MFRMHYVQTIDKVTAIPLSQDHSAFSRSQFPKLPVRNKTFSTASMDLVATGESEATHNIGGDLTPSNIASAVATQMQECSLRLDLDSDHGLLVSCASSMIMPTNSRNACSAGYCRLL